MRLSIVVLPEPEGPSRTANSPRAISKLTSSTACVAPKCFDSERTEIAASLIAHGLERRNEGRAQGRIQRAEERDDERKQQRTDEHRDLVGRNEDTAELLEVLERVD